MTIYVVVDKETLTNVAVEVSWVKAMEKTRAKDYYFLSKEDFYKNYENAYIIEEWEVK